MSDTGEELTVEISGISEDISKDEIEVHFQKKKYGGGDVTVKTLEDGKATMVIEGLSSEMQKAVLQMRHVIDGQELSLELVKQPPVPDITTTLPLVTGGGTVVVRGFQHPIHQEMLELYFTNASKSGGGDIVEVVMREKEVFVVFTEQAVATRVAERPSHSILGQTVEVQLVNTEPATGEHLLAPVTPLDTIVVKGLGVHKDKSLLDLYFTNRVASGGGEVKMVEVKGAEAYVTFVDPEVSARVAQRTHKIVGQDVEVQLLPQPVVTTSERLYPTLDVMDTVLVKGLSTSYNESVLKLYFTNKKKSGGGDVTSIAIKEEIAYVSFADPEVAAKVAETTYHKILGQDVEVQLVAQLVAQPVETSSEQLYPPVDVMDTVLVKGLSTSHNESVLKLYFTNKKKSGGGDVTSIAIKGEVAYVSFLDSNVAARVADKKFHKIVGVTVEVELVAPVGPIESVTSDDPNSHDNYDNILILDNVPQTVQDEVLLLYIDSITELDGEDGDYTIARNNTEVAVTFKPDNMPPAGLDDLITKISSTPLMDILIQASRPVVSAATSVLMEKIPVKKCDKDWLDMYLTNTSLSGIESYKEIQIIENGRVIVHLNNKNDTKTLLSRSHPRIGNDVVVTQCKSPLHLSVISAPPVVTPRVYHSAFIVKVNKPFVNCLKKSQDELNEMFKSLFATLSVDTKMEQVYINPCSGCESMEDWQSRCQSTIDSYVGNLVTETVSFPCEVKNAVLPFILTSMQSNPQLDIEFDEENYIVRISGEKQKVSIVKDRIEEICDAELSKTEPVSIEDAKILAFFSLKQNELLENHPEIKASVDAGNCIVSIAGTKSKREAYKRELDLLKEKMVSITVGISNDIVQFLSTTTGGKRLLQSYLEGFESLVTVHFDPDEVLVLLCSTKNDGANVAKKIETNVVSTIVPHPTIFLPSLQSEKWDVLQSNLEETYLVSVCFSNDQLTVIGDKKSVDFAKDDIQQFIESECHEEKSIPLYGAQWRLLSSHMAIKWSKIEQKLENESKIKYFLPSGKDKNTSIVLKGEKQAVTEFSKQIEQIISSISTSPPIELARPGTVRFFYSEKGTTLVRGIEAEEKSCIQLDVLQDGSEDITESEFTKGGIDRVCMGTTKEGKVITLVKGDITEFPADVIVNAANVELKHIGGVALAIANKGGPVIQEESNRLIKREGKLGDGDAVMATKVGKLPCKRLIHAVGPKWNGGFSNEEAFLKKACLESLKLATNFRLVCFPAISSGVFGFPLNTCAACMIKAFMEYSAGNALSTLHEITIVVRDYSAISAFSQEMSQKLSNYQGGTATVLPSISPNTEPEAAAHPRSKRRNPSGKPIGNAISKADHHITTQFIQLHKGELLKQKADVYVNTAGDNLNLRQGAVATSFLKAGGRALQDECSTYVAQNGKVPIGEVVVTGPGTVRCKKIIHTVGPVYDGKRSEQILQDLVRKCLEMCDKIKASTIAFPALGAGNLSYPQNVVADIMVSTITSYLKTNLATTHIKAVKLVIFMDNTYSEFNKLLKRKPGGSPTMPPAVSTRSNFYEEPMSYHHGKTHSAPAESFPVGSVNVEILQGDITEDDSDAIVNTTNETMQLVGSGVAGAILRKGGPEMQMMCDAVVSQGFKLQEGKVCDTPATGQLKCKKIFHVVATDDRNQALGKTISACLKHAEKLKFSSIAFPAIGTGMSGYSLDDAAQSICSSIIVFGQNNPMHVNHVRIIIYQTAMYQSFKDKFLEIINKPGLWRRMTSAVSSWIYGDSSADGSITKRTLPSPPQPVKPAPIISEKSVLLIQIYAEDSNIVKKTEERLHRLIDEQFTNENFPDEEISKFTSKQKEGLRKKAKQKHVEITIETGKDFSYIKLRGDRNDVADLKVDIQQIIGKIRAAESKQREAKLLQDKVKWSWVNDDNEYEEYDALTNLEIEDAFKSNEDKVFIYEAEGIKEKFNFKKMEASEDRSVYKIKRVDIEDLLKQFERPPHWKDMLSGVTCSLITLTATDREYKDVKGKFEATMSAVASAPSIHSMPPLPYSHFGAQYTNIVKIERVQNVMLYAQYVTKKKTMDQKSAASNEKELFHGCPRDVVDKITHQGFNRSFAGKNATMYGKGVYFARDANYSARDQYSPRDGNNHKAMFLAKVLVGDFTVGHSNCITPPPKSANGLELYDSVVDDVNNPQIYVIFADAQAYPDYLITFT